MAHFWIYEQLTGWAILPLESKVLLSPDPAQPVRAPDWSGPALGSVHPGTGSGEWTLLCRDFVRVNGEEVALGIRVLADRDEIVTPAGRFFFSTETLATVVAFPGTERPCMCPRCKREISVGALGICCPTCSTWYHENSDDGLCYSYGPCLVDQLDPANAASFRFDPNDFDAAPAKAVR